MICWPTLPAHSIPVTRTGPALSVLSPASQQGLTSSANVTGRGTSLKKVVKLALLCPVQKRDPLIAGIREERAVSEPRIPDDNHAIL